jgi:hypothetical protein
MMVGIVVLLAEQHDLAFRHVGDDVCGGRDAWLTGGQRVPR